MAQATSGGRRAGVLHEKAYWATFLIGVAVMAGIDEIVFHQILGWHHFYDAASREIGLLSDGLLHAAELIALVAGFLLLARARRAGRFPALVGWAGFVVGLGFFQLWDGTINHKVLRLHQVRSGVDDLLVYDLAWNGAALGILAVGIALTVAAARRRGLG